MLRAPLFVPGNKPSMLAKIPSLEADALILDLEDSVAPDHRVKARGLVREFLKEQHSQSIWVRINPSGTDLSEIAPSRPDGFVIPKVADHDALYGAVRFEKAARDAGIRPIFGAELTLEGDRHLTLLVKASHDAGLNAKFYTYYGGGLGTPGAFGAAGADQVVDAEHKTISRSRGTRRRPSRHPRCGKRRTGHGVCPRGAAPRPAAERAGGTA